MKKAVLYDHINKLHFISGLLVIICIPLYKYVLTWLMGVFIIIGIFRLFFPEKDKIPQKKINKYLLLSVAAFYCLLLIGLFYAKNMQEGLFDLQLCISLLFLPIIFSKPNRYIIKNANLYLLVFVIACLISVITGGAIFLFKYSGENFIKTLNESLTFFHHHSYMAMYLAFSIVILIYFIEKNISFKTCVQKLIAFLLVGIFICAIYFLFSKAGILAMILIIATSIFRVFSKKLLHIIIIIALCIPLVFVLLKNSQIKDLRNRVDYYKKSQTDKRYRKVIPVRIVIWENAIKLIKEKPVFGYGTSSSTTVLLEQYKKSKEEFVLKHKFNAHNQYFEILINQGILGLTVFLSIFALMLLKGFNTKNSLFINFTLLIMFFLLFETMLSTFSGASFIAFFIGFLFFIDSQTHNETIDKLFFKKIFDFV